MTSYNNCSAPSDGCTLCPTYSDAAKALESMPQSQEVAKAIQACMAMAKEETVALVTGVDKDGRMTIDVVPSCKSETWYGRLLSDCTSIYRRLAIRTANCSREWMAHSASENDPECKKCYERAEMIVHGFLCGLVFAGALFLALELLVIHRGGAI